MSRPPSAYNRVLNCGSPDPRRCSRRGCYGPHYYKQYILWLSYKHWYSLLEWNIQSIPFSRSCYLVLCDIMTIISHMKSKKSTGCDRISSIYLKTIRGEIAYPLSVVKNNSLCTGTLPDSIKIANVIPVYKAKDRQSMSNYRPIYITSIYLLQSSGESSI